MPRIKLNAGIKYLSSVDVRPADAMKLVLSSLFCNVYLLDACLCVYIYTYKTCSLSQHVCGG